MDGYDGAVGLVATTSPKVSHIPEHLSPRPVPCIRGCINAVQFFYQKGTTQ